jgi:hypothetical protein
MKSGSNRKSRHNLPQIHESADGSGIVRRKAPVAPLSPDPPVAPALTNWDGHSKRLNEIWGTASVNAIVETLDDLRGTR